MQSEEIRKILTEKLNAASVDIIDDSYRHAGHEASAEGGHFSVRVVSPLFEGKGLVDRHRLVYDALSMGNNPAIHALSIKALTPEEFKKG